MGNGVSNRAPVQLTASVGINSQPGHMAEMLRVPGYEPLPIRQRNGSDQHIHHTRNRANRAKMNEDLRIYPHRLVIEFEYAQGADHALGLSALAMRIFREMN